jgi:hypothetical protein
MSRYSSSQNRVYLPFLYLLEPGYGQERGGPVKGRVETLGHLTKHGNVLLYLKQTGHPISNCIKRHGVYIIRQEIPPRPRIDHGNLFQRRGRL